MGSSSLGDDLGLEVVGIARPTKRRVCEPFRTVSSEAVRGAACEVCTTRPYLNMGAKVTAHLAPKHEPSWLRMQAVTFAHSTEHEMRSNRTCKPEPADRLFVAELIERLGLTGAAKRLGKSRLAVLNVAHGNGCYPSTLHSIRAARTLPAA